MVPRERARRRVRGAVWDGDDGTFARHQRARSGRHPPSGEDRRPSMGVPRTVDDRGEAVSGPATRVAKLGIPEYRTRHEGRLREIKDESTPLGCYRDDRCHDLDVPPSAEQSRGYVTAENSGEPDSNRCHARQSGTSRCPRQASSETASSRTDR